MRNWRFSATAAVLAAATGLGVTALAMRTHGQTLVLAQTSDSQGRRGGAFETGADGGAQIGVSVRDVAAASAAKDRPAQAGAVIDQVRPDSPAEKAGFKAGDVVVTFDGERVRSARQFARLVDETPAGRQVTATVLRDGKSLDLQITPDRRETALVGPRMGGERMGRDTRRAPSPNFRFEMPEMRDLPDMSELRDRLEGDWTPGRSRLGVGVQDLTPELAQYFGAKQGVLVSAVTPDSPAAKAGVKVGDVITSVDGKTVENGGDLRRQLRRRDTDAAEVSLGLVRDKKERSVKVTLTKAEPSTSSTPGTRTRV